MASSTYESVPIKRLAEFLEEEQEPYTLDMYLSERFVKNKNNSGDASEKSCACNRMKSIRPRNSSTILSSITNKFIFYRKCSIHCSKNPRAKAAEQVSKAGKDHRLNKGEICSSYSEANAEGNYASELQGSTFGDLQIQNLETIMTLRRSGSMKYSNKQLVLKLPPSNGVSALQRNNSLCKVASLSKKQEHDHPTTDLWNIRCGSLKYVEDRGISIETKQLLINYASETIAIHGKQVRKGKSTRERRKLDDHGESTDKKCCTWKRHGDQKKIIQQIYMDISSALQEWSNFEQQNRETEIEIGDAILDDIVTEIINFN